SRVLPEQTFIYTVVDETRHQPQASGNLPCASWRFVHRSCCRTAPVSRSIGLAAVSAVLQGEFNKSSQSNSRLTTWKESHKLLRLLRVKDGNIGRWVQECQV